MIFNVIIEFLKGYLTLTENWSCHHANGYVGYSFAYCYNHSKNISRKECEEECTSSSSCIGYQYGVSHITKLDFVELGLGESEFLSYGASKCYLIPNSRKCPKDYYQVDTLQPIGMRDFRKDENRSIAKTTSDIIASHCTLKGRICNIHKTLCNAYYQCNQCYAKKSAEGKNLYSIKFQ